MGQLASFTLGAVTALFLTTFLPRVIPLKKKNITKDDLLLKAGTPPEDGFELEVLKAEQLTRNRAFLGAATLDILMKDTFVIIVGCGGVGSHAAHMLVRSGISNIRLIDFDLVTLSSLNRAPMATRKDVGKAKVHVLKEQLNAIAPWAHIDAKGVLFEGKLAEELLNIPPTFKYAYILDCIDHVPTKVDLLNFCCTNNISVISSMGAGCKLDPTKIRVCALSKSKEDPLARAIRRKMKRSFTAKNIMVVYSEERRNGISLMPLPEDALEALLSSKDDVVPASEVNPMAILPTFRSRILPVLGPLPAIFGMTMATHLIGEIYQKENSPE